MIKPANEIVANMTLNKFFEKPYYYLTNLDKITKDILSLTDEQIYYLHALSSKIAFKSKEINPSKYNICFNICVICTRLHEGVETFNEDEEN